MARGNQASTPQKKKKKKKIRLSRILSDNIRFSRDTDLDWECAVLLGGGQGGKEEKGVSVLGGEGRERTGSRDTRIFRVEVPGWAPAHSVDSFCTSLYPFTNE